jgi:hypothetical protein
LGTVSNKQNGILPQAVHIVGQRYQELWDQAKTGDVTALCRVKMKPFTEGLNNFMSVEFRAQTAHSSTSAYFPKASILVGSHNVKMWIFIS